MREFRVEFISRDGWKAVAPKRTTVLPDSAVRGGVLHYTSIEADETIDHADCGSRVRAIQSYHMNTKQWWDIAYNFLVCHHGYIFEGRGWDVESAAQGTTDGNEHYYAICFLGGDYRNKIDAPDVTRGKIVEFFEAVASKTGGDERKGHRDFHTTECPGDELYGWLTAGCPVGKTSGGAKPASGSSKPSAGAAKTGTPSWYVRELADGVHGDDVKAVQSIVGGIAVDGVFGPNTVKAVKAFQKKAGVTVDGIVGPVTASRLGERTLGEGDKGRDVAVVQAKLGVANDGVFGPKTLAAVKAFQKSEGLTVDGLVGPHTRGALGL